MVNTGSGVQVVGLKETIRSLQSAEDDLGDLTDTFSKIGEQVVADAKPNVDNRSGTLAGSIRASNSKNKSIVRAGSARIPYAGVIEYGGYNNITAQSYLRDAADENADDSVQILTDDIDEIIAKRGLR